MLDCDEFALFSFQIARLICFQSSHNYDMKMLNVIRTVPRRSRLPTVVAFDQFGFSTSAGVQEKIVKFKVSKKLPKIYTRTGDGGNSSLYTGERRNKTDKVFSALGAVDELSCHLGLAREMAGAEHPYGEQLVRVQCILQDIGSCVATPASSAREAHLANVGLDKRHAEELEEWIDEYTELLPPLENFILPGGGILAAQIHVARATCRRAEREVVALVGAGQCEAEAGRYLNRLSDFLFTISRVASRVDKKEETIYTRPDKTPVNYQQSGTLWKKKS